MQQNQHCQGHIARTSGVLCGTFEVYIKAHVGHLQAAENAVHEASWSTVAVEAMGCSDMVGIVHACDCSLPQSSALVTVYIEIRRQQIVRWHIHNAPPGLRHSQGTRQPCASLARSVSLLSCQQTLSIQSASTSSQHLTGLAMTCRTERLPWRPAHQHHTPYNRVWHNVTLTQQQFSYHSHSCCDSHNTYVLTACLTDKIPQRAVPCQTTATSRSQSMLILLHRA